MVCVRLLYSYAMVGTRELTLFTQVALFAIVMGLLGLIFFYIGISMGWLYVCFFLNDLTHKRLMLYRRNLWVSCSGRR